MMNTENKSCANMPYKIFLRVCAMILVIAIVCAGTSFAATSEKYIVDVYDGQSIVRVETRNNKAESIVKEAGFELSENDKLITDDFMYEKPSSIVVCRYSNVKLTLPDGTVKDLQFAGKVQELLDNEGIVLNDNLVVNVKTDDIITEGMDIKVLNSYGIVINVDGETKTVTSTAKTVGDLIKEQNIVLAENDETNPSLDTEIQNGMSIDVLRVEYAERTTTEKIPFTTKSVNSSALKKGETKITTQGVNGSKTVVYKDKIVNGQVVSSEKLSETVNKEPVNQVKTVGTLVVEKIGNLKIKKNSAPISEIALPSEYSIDGNNVPTSYKKVIKGKAAAYSIPGGTTATGVKAKPGYVAVNPNQIPYGTKLWIVSTDGIVYGYAIAADTGGFAKKGKFTVDLFMNSKSQCRQWGARDVNIYVL